MHVIVGMMRHVEIKHVADRRNIEAAGGDVGRDQQLGFAAAEGLECGGARRLIEIAVQRHGVELVPLQRFMQQGDFALAVAEDDGVLEVVGGAQQPAQGFALVGRIAAGRNLHLRDGGRGGGGFRDFDAHRIVQEVIGDALDFRRHGGREEQRLAREGHQFADALDVGNEAHVEHAVGFVDHQQFHAGQQQAAAFGMVEQAARCRDQHVDAANELGVLVAERDAADDQCDVELVVLAVFFELLDDLSGQFARWFENERARHAGAGTALFEHGEHRQHEGCGLAGSGLRNAENVAAREDVGNGLVLNGGGGLVAGRVNGGDYFVG